MSDSESQAIDERKFPPGTVRLSDKADTHLVLSPQPTSDPNDPLVRCRTSNHRNLTPLQELVNMAEDNPNDIALLLCRVRLRLPHSISTSLVQHE